MSTTTMSSEQQQQHHYKMEPTTSDTIQTQDTTTTNANTSYYDHHHHNNHWHHTHVYRAMSTQVPVQSTVYNSNTFYTPYPTRSVYILINHYSNIAFPVRACDLNIAPHNI
jgi:hypothetical protein